MEGETKRHSLARSNRPYTYLIVGPPFDYKAERYEHFLEIRILKKSNEPQTVRKSM